MASYLLVAEHRYNFNFSCFFVHGILTSIFFPIRLVVKSWDVKDRQAATQGIRLSEGL